MKTNKTCGSCKSHHCCDCPLSPSRERRPSDDIGLWVMIVLSVLLVLIFLPYFL